MIPPSVNIDTKCVKCHARVRVTEYLDSYRHRLSGRECVLHKCEKCGLLLAISIDAEQECAIVKNPRKELCVIMH